MGNYGTPGKCGNPGTNAGNFIGYANEIINVNQLSIELNGGNGDEYSERYDNQTTEVLNGI